MENTVIRDLVHQALLFNKVNDLCNSGIPVFEAIDVIAQDSPEYNSALKRLRTYIEGRNITSSDSLDSELKFHPFVNAMITVGVNTGSLDIIFKKLANYLGDEAKLRSEGIEESKLDKLTFYSSLSNCLDAGMPLAKSLQIVAEYCEFPPREVLTDICDEIAKKSSTLTAALNKHKDYFSPYVIALVSTGENGGILDTNFNRICEYTKEEHKLETLLK